MGFAMMALQSKRKKTMELTLLLVIYGLCIALASALFFLTIGRGPS
jgi:hypothetical protein